MTYRVCYRFPYINLWRGEKIIIDKIIIDQKYCGFLGIGNGGYVCGMAAGYIQGDAEVTLWNPPLVNVSFDVDRIDSRVLFKNGDVIIAEAQPASINLDVPSPPTYEEAVAASKHSLALGSIPPSPDCFVCGCNRDNSDGLRVFAGPAFDAGLVAAPWIPDASLADDSGRIREVFLWSVLDCPGAYAFFGDTMPAIVLGRLVAGVKQKIMPGEKCVIIGWKISQEGRKLISGSALFSESNDLCATAKATWLPMKNT